MKKVISIILFLFLIGVTSGTAQKYKSALGVRLDGQMFGLNYTQRFFNVVTAEGNLDFRSREVKITGMGKYHKPVLGKSLTLFFGAGYHIGNYKELGQFTGFDASVGIEHKILLLPFSLGFEINPSIHLTGEHPDWYTFQSVFSFKYIIKKDKEGYFSNSQQRQRQRKKRRRLKSRLKNKYDK